MSTLRKLELIGGSITLIVAVTYLILLVREDQQAAIQLQREFPLSRALGFGLMLFVLPGVLVFAGSFFHSVKNKVSGQLALLAGTLIIVAFFTLLFLVVPLYSLAGTFWIHLLFVLLAVTTITFSLLAGRRP